MRRQIVSLVAAFSMLLSGAQYAVAEGSPDDLQCSASGTLVINIKENILRNVDSGQAGNYWAFDTMTRKIKVYHMANGKYCAFVNDTGTFDAQAGQTSPGATGTLNGTEDGTFTGGSAVSITASFFL